MRTRKLLLGAPGTGKTETALRLIDDALQRGTPPGRVAFVSFTRAAVSEARQRAIIKFGLTEDDLPWFRTLHSLAFRALGMRRSEIVGTTFYRELEELTGEPGLTKGAEILDGPVFGTVTGGQLLGLDQSTRLRQMGLGSVWADHGKDVDWFRLLRFTEAYRLLREDRCMYDFTDLLERYVKEVTIPPDVDVAIVDEAQDLSALQWAVVRAAFGGVPEMTVAGDPNQAVHRWAGADPLWLDRFRAMCEDGEYTAEQLKVSYRLPEAIFKHARQLASRTEEADIYGTATYGRSGGTVEWVAQPEEVDLSSGTWLLLARGAYQLDGLEAAARDQGVYYERSGKPSVDHNLLRAVRAYEALRAGRVVSGDDANLVAAALGAKGQWSGDDEQATVTAVEFTKALGVGTERIWHDAFTALPAEDTEYLLACLRRGEKFNARPRVRLSTMHSAKGLEAEGVVLLTDIPPRAYRGLELDPAAEARVFYVGVTRASERLMLVAPRTSYPYHL